LQSLFAASAAEELPENAAQLHGLDHYWAMQSELKHTMGICARCEKQGEVVFYVA
jgi:hypothetical protein